RLDGDVVAELVELVDQASGLTGLRVGVEPFGEVVGAEVVVRDFTGEHDPYGDQNGMPDSDQGPFLATSHGDTPVAGGEVGALSAGGADSGLPERRFEPGIAVAGVAGLVRRPGLVVAGAHPGPGRQVTGGAEPGRVSANLGEDHFGRTGADARD